MSAHLVMTQTRFQNALTRMGARLQEERGEIGSQLILMAILVGAAVAATTVLRPAIAGLVGRISDSIGGADAG